MASAKNLYHRRLVAESSAKPCWICYKPSSTVLITAEPDASGSNDWFHICPGHLADRKFATAKDEEDPAEKARKEALDKEIELVKKEYEAKIAAKLKKKQEKEGKKEEKKEEKEVEEEEKAKDEKLKELEAKKKPETAKVEGPRIFELHKNFWAMRLQKKRDTEQAKKNRERMRDPSFFPSVPHGQPTA